MLLKSIAKIENKGEKVIKIVFAIVLLVVGYVFITEPIEESILTLVFLGFGLRTIMIEYVFPAMIIFFFKNKFKDSNDKAIKIIMGIIIVSRHSEILAVVVGTCT